MPKRDPLTLGIDLGGTKILTSIINPQGEILSRDHSITPAAEGPEVVIEAILASAKRTFEEGSVAIDKVTAVGVGAPGPSDPEAGILFTSTSNPWAGWRCC